MSHPRRYSILTAMALDFELEPRDAADLAAHLQGCPECRRLREALRGDAAAAHAVAADAPLRTREIVLTVAARPTVIVLGGRSYRQAWTVGVIAILAALLLATLAVVGARSLLESRTTIAVTTAAPSAALASPPGLVPSAWQAARVGATIPVSGGGPGVCRPACAPTAVTVAFGSVWVSALDAIIRLDPSSRAVTATIPTTGAPTSLVPADGALWAVIPDRGVVVRIDPATNRITGTIATGSHSTAIAVLEGRLWVASETRPSIARYEESSGRLVGSVSIGHGAVGLLAVGSSIWAATASGLVELSGSTGKVTATVPGPCCQLAFGDATLWVSDGGLRLWRIDQTAGRADALAAPGDYSGSLAAGDGALWAFDGLDLTLERIDPRDTTTYAKTDLSALVPPGTSNPYTSGTWAPAIAVGSGGVWMRSYDPDRVLQVVAPPGG